jgi:hypothetical protein
MAFLAAAKALVGDTARARLHAAEYAARHSEMTLRRLTEVRCLMPISAVSPVFLPENAGILEGMRRAAMRDLWFVAAKARRRSSYGARDW